MQDQIFSNSHTSIPLLRLAFRPFFLFGSLFASIALIVWIMMFRGQLQINLYGGEIFWHTHEMIFGFVAAIVVGFLLTAVQNWTGVKSVNGLPLFVLLTLWLVARIGFLFGDLLPSLLLTVIDISFLAVAAIFLAVPLIKVKQVRNLFFVPVLLVFAVINGMMHFGKINLNHSLIIQATQSGLLLVAILMMIIGGRVIPFFTANGTGTRRVEPVMWLERATLTFSWLLLLIFISGLAYQLPQLLVAGLFVIVAVLHLVRWWRWRFWITFGVSLLWSLHLAYLFMILALLVIAGSWLFDFLSASLGWHLLTIGGMGAMILSMISRVSLGHTGRPIKGPSWMVPAFITIFISALVRTLGVYIFPQHYLTLITFSGILWSMSFLVFVLGYFFILTKARVDNKPG